VSAVGGRTLATELIDAGLVTDVYLTISPRDGGTPGTPMHPGKMFPRDLVLRKRDDQGVTFEHWRL
jgi:dihydrofolate reductase